MLLYILADPVLRVGQLGLFTHASRTRHTLLRIVVPVAHHPDERNVNGFVVCVMKMASRWSVSATGSGVSESGESVTLLLCSQQPTQFWCWCPSRISQMWYISLRFTTVYIVVD